MSVSTDRFTVARHTHTVGKSSGAALLFAAFNPSPLVMGHKPFPGRLPQCRLALVLLLRWCRSAVKCSRLSHCSLVFFFLLSFFCEDVSLVVYLHGCPGFCTKRLLSVCQSSCALRQTLATAWSRAEPPVFTHPPRGGSNGALLMYPWATLKPSLDSGVQ